MERETCEKWPKRHTDRIVAVAEIAGARTLVTTSLDRQMILWDIDAKAALTILAETASCIHTLKYSVDFNLLISVGYEKTGHIWEVGRRNQCAHVGTLDGHTAIINAVELVSNTCLILTGDSAGVLKVWDIRT
jgi:WD40 repeat protein